MTKPLEALIAEMKAAAEKTGSEQWQAKKEKGGGYSVIVKGSMERRLGYTTFRPVTDEVIDKKTADFIAKSNPQNVLALIAALELSDKQRESWKQIAQTSIAEREKDIAELDTVRKRIAELESQNITASNALLDAGKRIAELEAGNSALRHVRAELSREANDLEAKLEASQLAVKLPQNATPLDVAAAIRACMDEFPEAVQDIVEECAVIAENTIRAAGGTVGGE